MIGRIAGTVLRKAPPEILIDVAGVGYELDVPLSTFYELPAVGEKTVLLVHMVVREDAQLLYGFVSEIERQLFRVLLKVNGVGAKVALAILSSMNSREFMLTIERKDVASLIRIPGVGKKTAERLIVELQDKLKPGGALSAIATDQPGSADAESNATCAPALQDNRSQAIDALVALGYKPTESTRLVDSAVSQVTSQSTIETIIRAALKSTVSTTAKADA